MRFVSKIPRALLRKTSHQKKRMKGQSLAVTSAAWISDVLGLHTKLSCRQGVLLGDSRWSAPGHLRRAETRPCVSEHCGGTEVSPNSYSILRGWPTDKSRGTANLSELVPGCINFNFNYDCVQERLLRRNDLLTK